MTASIRRARRASRHTMVAAATLGLASAAAAAVPAAPAVAVLPPLTATMGSAVVSTAIATTPDSNLRFSGPTQITLVSPTGAKTAVATIGGGWKVADVSNDGRRVLLTSGGGASWARIYDLQTRTLSTVNGILNGRFTNPSGLAIIGAGTTGLPRVTDLTGRVKRVLSSEDVSLPTLDGTRVVTSSVRSPMQVLSLATGRRVAAVAVPTGAQYCFPSHWLSATTFVGSCSRYDDATGTETYRLSVAGAAPVKLFGAPNWSLSAWYTPAGTFLETEDGKLARVQGTRVTVFPGQPDPNHVLTVGTWVDGVVGTKAWVHTLTATTWTVLHYDLTTGAPSVTMSGRVANGARYVSGISVVDPNS